MSRVVFVGNIPFDMAEEQVIDIFKEVGPVVSFRLMFDRDSGKPRGYGFCEFADAETASSAIRNLNGYDVGGRALRVDYADNEMSPSTFGSGGPGTSVSAGTGGPAPVPPLKQQPTSSTVSVDLINSTLSGMSNTQLLDIISQLKQMSIQSPEQARSFLVSNPALAYAVLQAMMILNLVDSSTITQQQIVSQAARPPADDRERHQALIMQILSMTPEQIHALPPEQRDQILLIRAQIQNTPNR